MGPEPCRGSELYGTIGTLVAYLASYLPQYLLQCAPSQYLLLCVLPQPPNTSLTPANPPSPKLVTQYHPAPTSKHTVTHSPSSMSSRSNTTTITDTKDITVTTIITIITITKVSTITIPPTLTVTYSSSSMSSLCCRRKAQLAGR